MYKTKAAICSQIRTKHSKKKKKSEHHVEFLNVNLLAPEFYI